MQKRAAAQMTLRLSLCVATTSAAAAGRVAVRASVRPAGHPVLDFAAADRVSALGRPVGRLGLDCSCDASIELVFNAMNQSLLGCIGSIWAGTIFWGGHAKHPLTSADRRQVR